MSTSDILIELPLLAENIKLAFSFKACATGIEFTGALSTGVILTLIIDVITELPAFIPSLKE